MILPLLVTLASTPVVFPMLPPPQAYVRRIDQRRAAKLLAKCGKDCLSHPRAQIAALLPCREPSLSTEQCFRLSPPFRMRGIWQTAFEHSQFYPDATRPMPFNGKMADRIWLNITVPLPQAAPTDVRQYRIDFVGRRTLYPWFFGHLGMFNHEVIVDRVLSIKRAK